MRDLSKSKLMAYRQCPRRLWLEVFRPELREDSAAAETSFAIGHEVGEIARQLHDPKGLGTLVDRDALGFPGVYTETERLLTLRKPIFEASFRIPGALAMADVLLPVGRGASRKWRMVEVKSSTSVKDHYRDDAAIQAYVAREAGLALDCIAVAHIDSNWVYPGSGAYEGLLAEEDLTAETKKREPEVAEWIAGAQLVVAKKKEPDIATGKHCTTPHECGFFAHCSARNPVAQFPVEWLPRRQKRALVDHIETKGIIDMRDVPDDLLNDNQLRVKAHTLNGKTFFDKKSAAAMLAAYKLPAIFLDFETASFAVPIWKGTRPYQQIPFQFSAHRLSRNGSLHHTDFLDLTGKDPSRAFAKALLNACGERGPVFVYNQTFEKSVILGLAARIKPLASALEALTNRLVDLLPVAQQHYYHPAQEGSWSIKAVLPTIAPELDYTALDGVKDGGMAQAAFAEAVHPATTSDRRTQIQAELSRYCELDTFAMVRLWQEMSGTSITLSR